MNRELAGKLWNLGGGHALGAEAIVRRAQEWAQEIEADDIERAIFNGKFSASIYLLFGYGFELLLKAAYIAHGGNPKKLGNGGIGHDLEAALRAAEEQGFRSSAPHLGEIIALLRLPHLEHQFRYGGMEEFPVPANVDVVLANLHHLAGELQAIIYPEGR